MPGRPGDLSRESYIDASEGTTRQASGSSRTPLDLMRYSVPRFLDVGEPLPDSLSLLVQHSNGIGIRSSPFSPSTLEAPAEREQAPVSTQGPTHAMSPGGTIYNLGAPRSMERKIFSAGPARSITNASGIPIGRPTDQQLSSKDISDLTRSGRIFAGSRGWESFSDPSIESRDDLDRARGAFLSAAKRKRNETLGSERLSEITCKANKTRGAQCSYP